MNVPCTKRRDVVAELQYQYWRYREIDRTIKALERVQRMRQSDSSALRALRRRADRAA